MKEADVKTGAGIAEGLPEKTGRSAKKPANGTKKSATARTVFVDSASEWLEKPAGGAAKGKKNLASDAKAGAKSAGTGEKKATAGAKSAGTKEKKAKGRAKARNGGEKLTPAALYRKMIAFGKTYQVDKEQDFIEAARIYAEEAGLIDQMRDRIAEDGLTVEKTYKTGSVDVAHPLLSELPRHVESANKCLATIGNMIGERGARVEKAARDLDAFRLH